MDKVRTDDLNLFQSTNQFSTNTYCGNKNTWSLTYVNLITEVRMQRNTYLYENRMFTNKMKHSIISG